MVARGKTPQKLAKVRTEKDKRTRAAADRYARATDLSLPASHRWLLGATDSHEDTSRASKSMEIAADHGLDAVKCMAAATNWCPEQAVIQLEGKVDREAMSTLPSDVLYMRMCEFEALALSARTQVAFLYQELSRRGDLEEAEA